MLFVLNSDERNVEITRELVDDARHEDDILDKYLKGIEAIRSKNDLVILRSLWQSLIKVQDKSIQERLVVQIIKPHTSRAIQVKDSCHIGEIKAVHAQEIIRVKGKESAVTREVKHHKELGVWKDTAKSIHLILSFYHPGINVCQIVVESSQSSKHNHSVCNTHLDASWQFKW